MRTIYIILNIFISLVWLVNGLVCKVLDIVPRHRLIVSHILGNAHAGMATRAIGLAEILVAVWVLSSVSPRRCAVFQAVIITAMNLIEFLWVPDLLLFGRVNSIIAACFIFVICFNEFRIRPSLNTDR